MCFPRNKCVKVFKNGPGKICGRQPLKNFFHVYLLILTTGEFVLRKVKVELLFDFQLNDTSTLEGSAMDGVAYFRAYYSTHPF